WRVDPFAFRAFKVSVGMLLDYLEPEGPAVSIFDTRRVRAEIEDAGLSQDEWQTAVGRFYESPEVHGAYIFSWLLRELSHEEPSAQRAMFMSGPSFLSEPNVADFYGLQDARRDLGLDLSETNK